MFSIIRHILRWILGLFISDYREERDQYFKLPDEATRPRERDRRM